MESYLVDIHIQFQDMIEADTDEIAMDIALQRARYSPDQQLSATLVTDLDPDREDEDESD